MGDIYQNWRDRLAGKDVPTHADHPEPGRYKMRRGRDGEWLPVAIGPDGDGSIKAVVNGCEADPLEIWTWAAKNPVSQDAYKFRIANGHWPDEPKPAVRSNMPDDPLLALLAEITDKAAQAEEVIKSEITNQTQCDLARNIQAQLLALNKRADAMHKAEKAPVLEAERAVEAKFSFRKNVASLASALREKFERWMQGEERRQREEAQRKLREEQARVAAECARIEAERAKQKDDDPVAFHTSPEPELPEMPTVAEPVKVSAGGGFGRKSGLKSVWVASLTDVGAALAHYRENAKLIELLQKLADADVRAGKRTIPGFTVSEERRAA